MEELCKALNITKRNIVPHNPQSNSAERVHRTMGQIFRTLTLGKEKDWSTFIPAIILALNSAVHRTTGFSPMFLMHGHQPRLERTHVYGRSREESNDPQHYAIELEERLEIAFNIVKENVEKNLAFRSKEFEEQDAKEFQPGKHVLVFGQRREIGSSPKL